MKTETRGRKRIGKEVTIPITFSVEPGLKRDLKDEAYRAEKTLSQLGAYALRRYLNAKRHTRRLEAMNNENFKKDRNII